MIEKELKDTEIVTGWKSAYIAKKIRGNSISRVRREITENEILALMVWYSENKFEEDDVDEYTITDDKGEVILCIKKGDGNEAQEGANRGDS